MTSVNKKKNIRGFSTADTFRWGDNTIEERIIVQRARHIYTHRAKDGERDLGTGHRLALFIWLTREWGELKIAKSYRQLEQPDLCHVAITARSLSLCVYILHYIYIYKYIYSVYCTTSFMQPIISYTAPQSLHLCIFQL